MIMKKRRNGPRLSKLVSGGYGILPIRFNGTDWTDRETKPIERYCG